LNVAFLQDVEQGDLDAGLQVRQFVDHEDATVAAGNQTKVNDFFIGITEPKVGCFDRVEVTDQVRNGNVWCGEFLGVAFAAVQPSDAGIVTVLGEEFDRAAAQRCKWIVLQFRTIHNWNPFVQQSHHLAGKAGFGLTPKAQQDHVVAAQNGPFDVGNDGVFVAVNAGKDFFARFELDNQVVAELIFDGP
jgi:hypothetical protein